MSGDNPVNDAEARALGERYLAAGGEWRAGMRGVLPASGHGGRVYLGSHGVLCWQGEESGYVAGWPEWAAIAGGWPDLRDPATRGAVLEVLRERLGPVFLAPDPDEVDADGDGATRYLPTVRQWRVVSWVTWETLAAGPTEAAALVAALEAAPRHNTGPSGPTGAT